jgi:hypothetical protein
MIARALPPLLVAAAVLSAAQPARAVTCSSLPNLAFVAGSGDIVVADVAKALARSGISVVYLSIGSCIAVDAILNGTPLGGTQYPTAIYYDNNGNQQTCDTDPTGNDVDIGFSDVFASTCDPLPNGLPNGVQDFFAPVEAHTMSVPAASHQTAISKKAGYFVFGFGSESGAAPWTDASLIFNRGPLSGTQQMISAALGLPADRWQGTTEASSGAVVSALANASNPEAAIGILTAEVAQSNPSQVSILAFQDEGQSCAYYPDSTRTARDKINVRDGHYAIWGPEHMHTHVNSENQPTNPVAREVIGYIEGTIPPPAGTNFIQLFAQANLVPECAMLVQRTSELGPLSSAPGSVRSCGCYFDQVTSGSTKCKACTADAGCPTSAPVCNYGFCEAH